MLLMLVNERPKWSYYSSSPSSGYTSGRNTQQNGEPDCSGSNSAHYSTCLALPCYMGVSFFFIILSYLSSFLSAFTSLLSNQLSISFYKRDLKNPLFHVLYNTYLYNSFQLVESLGCPECISSLPSMV